MGVSNGVLGYERADQYSEHTYVEIRSVVRYLTGVNVSNPLAADHGSPFFLTLSCMFRAVMSIARARTDSQRFPLLYRFFLFSLL